MTKSLFACLFLASLGCCLIRPSCCVSDSTNFIEGVQKLLTIQLRPNQISTIFCGNVEKEFELLQSLTTLSDHPIPATRVQANIEYFQHLFVVDLNQCTTTELIRHFSEKKLGLIYSRWMILVDSSKSFGATEDIVMTKTLSKVDLSQLSEIFYLTTNGQDKLVVKMAYKLERVFGSRVILEEIGHFQNYSSAHFIDTRTHKVTSMRRKDMMGENFPIASVLMNPDSVNHYFDFVDVEVDPVAKSGHRLGVTVLQFLNATPQIILSNSWGSFNSSTGNWTGMMGDLSSGAAILGGTPSFITANRVHLIEYMSVSLESFVRIVFRAPKLSYTTNVYLLPFERGVWVAAFILFSATTLLLLAAATGEWKMTAGHEEEQRPRLIDVVFVTFSAICNQGSSFNVHSVGGRIVLLSCLVLVVCLFVSYCAFIVVLLQSPATNIQTVEDLLNSRMQIGSEDTIYNRYWLQRLTDPVEKALYDRRIVNKDGTTNFYALEEGVRKVQQGLFAFHMECPVGYRVVTRLYNEGEKCDLREIAFANMKNPYSTVQKNSPFREALRIGMLRVKEQGIQRRLSKQVYQTKPKCTNRNAFSALTLIDISPAIFILAFGLCLSMVILGGEMLIRRYRNSEE